MSYFPAGRKRSASRRIGKVRQVFPVFPEPRRCVQDVGPRTFLELFYETVHRLPDQLALAFSASAGDGLQGALFLLGEVNLRSDH